MLFSPSDGDGGGSNPVDQKIAEFVAGLRLEDELLPDAEDFELAMHQLEARKLLVWGQLDPFVRFSLPLILDVDFLIGECGPPLPCLSQIDRHTLFLDLNSILDQYRFEASYRSRPTAKQLEVRFGRLNASLNRLKLTLPSPRYDPQYDVIIRKRASGRPEVISPLRPSPLYDPLFEVVCRHGEAYAKADAKKHAPHRRLRPVVRPPVKLIGFQLSEERDFRSSHWLRELIETVDLIEKWTREYKLSLVPKGSLEALKKAIGGTNGVDPHLRLIGRLPAVYKKYFGELKMPPSSTRDRDTGERKFQPWINFAYEVCRIAKIHTKSRSGSSGAMTHLTVETYWKRAGAKNDPSEFDASPAFSPLPRAQRQQYRDFLNSDSSDA